jgi:hypothetical protein
MRLDVNELFQSRLSDRKGLPYGQFNQPQIVPIARVNVDTGVAQAWRVTLGRIDRADDNAVGHPGDPGGSFSLYEGQQYQYDFWLLGNPIVPPRRASPIFNATDPANGADIRDAFVEIAWGNGDGARPNRMLAQWPVQGASLTVTGTYVEVWAGQLVGDLGTPQIPATAFPMFQAQIVQEASVATSDGGAELSLIATVGIADREEGFFNFVGFVPEQGLNIDGNPNGAIRGSVVQNVAPFHGFDATVTPRVFSDTPRITVAIVDLGGASFVARQDNGAVDAAGNFSPSPGNVAILINQPVGGTVTFLNLQNALNGSAIIQVSNPTGNPGDIIASAPNAFSLDLITFLPFNGHTLGIGAVAPTLEGALMYVPDFARRVRVDVTDNPAAVGRVPFTGPPKAVLAWYDDRGQVVTSHYQGVIIQAAAIVATEPVTWHPVPDNAVVLGVFSDPALQPTATSARFHWRIAP